MQCLGRRRERRRENLFVGGIEDIVIRSARRTLWQLRRDIGDEMRNAQLGIAFGSYSELLVVALTLLSIGKYATGMIDESQRLFDVALAIARLGIIFSN